MKLHQPSIPELGSLTIPFPSGWTFEYQDHCPVEGFGPNDEFALISFSEAPPDANEDQLRTCFEQFMLVGKELVRAVAEEKGTPQGDLSVLHEKGGRTIYALASRTDRNGIEGYYLQYVCASLVSQHHISIGGCGSVEEARAIWDDIMSRITWKRES